jgi:hypothetical protein
MCGEHMSVISRRESRRNPDTIFTYQDDRIIGEMALSTVVVGFFDDKGCTPRSRCADSIVLCVPV